MRDYRVALTIVFWVVLVTLTLLNIDTSRTIKDDAVQPRWEVTR